MVLAQKQTNRSMEQDRKPRDKTTHLWTYGQLTYDKGGKNIYWGKDKCLLQRVVLGKLNATCKTIKLNHFPTPHHIQKINSKWF